MLACDWLTQVGCAAHDASNGLKWGLAPRSAGDIVSDLYISVEAIRNTFVGLHSKLPLLLATTVVFDRHHVDDEAEAALWTALGVGPDWLGDFITVAPQWHRGALHVRASLEGGVHGMELISSVLGYAMRWRKFAENPMENGWRGDEESIAYDVARA